MYFPYLMMKVFKFILNVHQIHAFVNIYFANDCYHGKSTLIYSLYPANICLGEDMLKTCSIRLQDVFSIKFFYLPKLFKTPWWHFANISLIRLANTSGKCIEDVVKSSWKINNCYSEDVFKRSLGQHFSTCHFRKYQYSKKAFSSFFKRERNFSVSRKFPRYFWT